MPPSTLDDPFQPPSAPTGPAAHRATTRNRGFLLVFSSLLWLVLGGLAIGGTMKLSGLTDDPDRVPVALAVVGLYFLIFVGLFFAGSALWARAKGYHPFVGVLLACVGPMGLLVLALLTDRPPLTRS